MDIFEKLVSNLLLSGSLFFVLFKTDIVLVTKA